MTRLIMGDPEVDLIATKSLRGLDLKARNRGDVSSAMLSAGYYARKLGHAMFGYSGNSYGSAVWRVSDKPSEYLNPINNTGKYVFSVTPDLTVARHEVSRPEDLTPNHSPDLSHLNALELRLSHERERLRAARTPREKAFRAQQVAGCEREIAGEREFLKARGVDLSIDDEVAGLSDDELLAELESNPASPLEWIKGSGVDRDGHSLTWWKNKSLKWSKSEYDRPKVYIRVYGWDSQGRRDEARSGEFLPDDLKGAKAFARECVEAGGSVEVQGRVEIPYQGNHTIELGQWRNTASNGYYVWSVESKTQMPVTRRGPIERLDEAIGEAKVASRGGSTYDEVVTFGGDPEAGDFEVIKAFKAWSGEVHYSSDLPRVGGRLRELRR